MLAIALLGATLAACGGDDDDGGPVELSWFIFNEPSGVLPTIAKRCSEESNGEYTIRFEYLPSDADQQREQLVRRLGAEDDSIDIIGMDVIWTGEFANAGWIEEWTGDAQQAATDKVFPSMVESASFEGKLYGAPIWTNTQLLWYRKDRTPKPPTTWTEMFEMAAELPPEERLIQVQGNRYEGLVVWFNAMVESAGTSIVSPDDAATVALDQEATVEALTEMVELSQSEFADPAFSTSDEDSARLAFQDGASSFMLNYPFVYPSAEAEAPDVFKQMRAARYPAVVEGEESAPPLGGINLGVSKFSQNKDQAFDAIQCLIQSENQLEIAATGGLPPVREDLFDSKEIEKVYPGFSDVVRESIDAAAPRPVTPAYQDLSLGIQRGIHPLDDISLESIETTVEELREQVQTALDREGLL